MRKNWFDFWPDFSTNFEIPSMQPFAYCSIVGEPVDGAKFKAGLTQVGKIKTCKSPAHNPPNGMAYEPGVYVWKCEACGEAFQFATSGA